MGRKLRMNEHFGQAVAEVYQDFILAKTAEGVSDVTIRNYHQHLHNISKYLDIEQPMAALSKRDLERMVCEMRAAGLAHNSISIYVRALRTFLNWCQREGRANLIIPNMKDKETVKETYTDEELSLLFQKPKSDCFLGNICSAISMGKCSLVKGITPHRIRRKARNNPSLFSGKENVIELVLDVHVLSVDSAVKRFHFGAEKNLCNMSRGKWDFVFYPIVRSGNYLLKKFNSFVNNGCRKIFVSAEEIKNIIRIFPQMNQPLKVLLNRVTIGNYGIIVAGVAGISNLISRIQ